MYTSSELAMLRAVDHNAVLPGIDTPTGNQDLSSSLMQFSQLPLLGSAFFNYDPATNILRVMKDGVGLNGINFGNVTVMILANNVTIENCTFTATTGWYAVDQVSGYSGAVVKNCTFDSLAETGLELAAWVDSRNAITIQNNTFLNSPSDAVDISAGTVSGNYFSGSGYNNTSHPDAIWVSGSTGAVVITNNFIDYTMNADSIFSTNNCVRISTQLGSVDNVTVSGNYMIGGATVIDAGNIQSNGGYSNINIINNYIGFGTYWDFYPGPQTGVTKTGNVIFDYTNTAYSTTAWAAYQAKGIVTNTLVTATAAQTSINAAATGASTLYGNGENIHLYGGASETIFIGGAGIQYDWGGSGKDIFTYLSFADSTFMSPDLIGNFNVSADVIDLHAINANPASSSTVNFTFIGGAAFSGAGGEVRVVQDVAHNQTDVEANMTGDSSADLVIRLGGLLNLTAANFALTTAQYNAAIASYTTVASFLGSQASLDQVAAGFSIVDSLANVQHDLAALQADAGHINAVTLSDSTAAAPAVLTLSYANASADAAILAKIASPYVLDAVVSSATIVTGHGSGLTINIAGSNGVGQSRQTVTGGGAGDTFYFYSNFGAVEITDFAKYASTATPDMISLSTRDFANWSTLLADGRQVGANTAFTAVDGVSLTLDGVSLKSLQSASAALKAEFKFHA